MRISCYAITLHFKGIVHKAFRIGLARDYTKPVDETCRYIALGTSADDARDRVRSAIMPALNTLYESLSITWGFDGDGGDFVEISKAGKSVLGPENAPPAALDPRGTRMLTPPKCVECKVTTDFVCENDNGTTVFQCLNGRCRLYGRSQAKDAPPVGNSGTV